MGKKPETMSMKKGTGVPLNSPGHYSKNIRIMNVGAPGIYLSVVRRILLI